jgi:hypothetical protein
MKRQGWLSVIGICVVLLSTLAGVAWSHPEDKLAYRLMHPVEPYEDYCDKNPFLAKPPEIGKYHLGRDINLIGNDSNADLGKPVYLNHALVTLFCGLRSSLSSAFVLAM